ncbi:hypothetical protein DFH11DRAFT_1232198 [Phellopilus nigrolimitatus]|nr:hypothetical protein DFH11DRAFT_1232198 [Phellopilus nigrolimitatus]
MSSDGPPSYESVVARFEQSLGSNPKPQDVLNAIDQLPQYEIGVLSSNPHEMPVLTDEQKAAFSLGVAKTISSPEAADKFKEAAVKASAACKAIEIMFTNLTVELAKIDAKNIPPKEGPFVPRLARLNQEYLRAVHLSKDLAVKISVYGQQFDTVIIPFCNDESQSTEERLKKITQFINEADTFSKDTGAIDDSFDNIKNDFTAFIGSFGDWASDKEGADTKELEQLRRDLKKMNTEISDLRSNLTVFSGIATAALPVVQAMLSITGPLVPFVIIGGLLVAGIGAVFMFNIITTINSRNNEVSAIQARIDDLVESVNDIKVTHEKLKLLGTENLQLFNQNIPVIVSLWRSAHNDALEIKAWLEGSAKGVDKPLYMEKSVYEAVSIYKTMADYLRQYADGIESVNVLTPSLA